jgi:hypothetical protein
MDGMGKKMPISKNKVEPRELAEALLNELVRKICIIRPDIDLDTKTTALYEATIRVYQLAAVLMALGVEEQKDPRFLLVRENLERIVFPPTPDREGLSLLADVKPAMQNLNALLAPVGEPKPLSWARDWLQSIGVE